jgi:hypothetical protein
MPAKRKREGMHGGRRPKSLEGGNRGPAWVARRGAMELWGFESRGQSAATSGSYVALPAGADTRAQRALFHYRQNGTERAKEQHRIWGEHPRHCSLGKAWHWGPNRVNPTRRGSTRCQSP